MLPSGRVIRFLKASLAFSFLFVVYKLITFSEDSTRPQIDFLDDAATGTLMQSPANYTDVIQAYASSLNMEDNAMLESPVNATLMLSILRFLNANHKVLNEGRFGSPTAENVDAVIVVQVHNRLEYLRYLLQTLENTKGIEKTLVVFSHDMNSPPINKAIQDLTFCRAIQIFYPNNIQLFPHEFPGQDPNDCPDRISRKEAEYIQCNNYANPDKYGHYRQARITQIKHHWWWKMNYVFDGIVKRYGLQEKYLLMLEEDHYVSPDALYVLDKMSQTRAEVCAECEVFSLGFYLKSYRNYEKDLPKLSVQQWFSSKHNMGMALKLSTWEKIRSCAEHFCKFDDYNWDWSLLFVDLKCMPSKMRVIVAKSPRVIHVGDCGVHTHRCEAHDATRVARSLFETHKKSLFPEKMYRAEVIKRTLKPSKPNGGWGDIRDHELCFANAYPFQSSDVKVAN